MSLVFRDTNLFTAAASVCGVTLEPTRPTPPSVCAPTDRTPPPVCGPPRPPTGPPLRSVGLRWALKPRTRPVHYKMTLVFGFVCFPSSSSAFSGTLIGERPACFLAADRGAELIAEALTTFARLLD